MYVSLTATSSSLAHLTIIVIFSPHPFLYQRFAQSLLHRQIIPCMETAKAIPDALLMGVASVVPIILQPVLDLKT